MLSPVCDCKIANHEHGTNAMRVIHGCRCAECREASNAMDRARRRQKAYGRYHLTDAQPARDHIRRLQAAGMGWMRIAEAAGVHRSAVDTILYTRGKPGDPEYRRPRKRISKALEAKILAVELDLADHAVIDALGTRRRLQALVAIGWPIAQLAGHLGVDLRNFNRMIYRGPRTTAGTARAVVEFFDANWDHVPPEFRAQVVSRAKNLAKRNGWVPAAAWDDIDDPTEQPKADLEDESIAHQSRPALEKIDRLELLIHDGHGDDDATYIRADWASRMSGWAVLRRMGREDLIERLHRNDRVRQVAS